MKTRIALVVLLVLAATSATASDVLLPTFAWNIAGNGTNNWSSEIYLTNPGAAAISVRLAATYVGRIQDRHPCMPPDPVTIAVPAYSTRGWVGSQIWRDMGCPDFIVAGLLLHAEAPFIVNSRMVNTFGPPSTSTASLVSGLSQEVPGIPVENLADKGGTYMVPAFGWEPSPCGSAQFENRLQVVNPNDVDAELTLMLDPFGTAIDFLVDGRPVAAPHVVPIRARSWVQIKIAPTLLRDAACMPPRLADVFFTTSHPVAVYGSVVDRASQDPRTSMPIEVLTTP
jgi:hypothetical protein